MFSLAVSIRVIDAGCGFAATFRSDEHVIFATYGDAAHGLFGCVVVEFKEPVIRISAQALHATESCHGICTN
jgi:hypothetical protein